MIAAELCALPLARFTAERNARAKAARDDGDRDLAVRVAALPKPSVAAWVVDLLARETPDDLQRVLQLGADLRAAQEALDRDRLRELTTERRSLLPEVARGAADRAEAAGQRVGDGVLEEVQQTLQAALADPAAASAVASGRLVRALDADGLDPADLGDTVAAGAPPTDTTQADSTTGRRRPEQEGDRRRQEAERREAERRLTEAKHRADDAASKAREAEAAVEERTRDVEDLRRRVDELQARLDTAQEALDEADDAEKSARRRADTADTELDRLTAG